MSLRVIAAESTELFVGPEDAPLQVVRVTVAGHAGPIQVHVEGRGISTPEPVAAATTGQLIVEAGVSTVSNLDVQPGTVLPARVVVRSGDEELEADFDLIVAEPGWTMHMVSHFHYDPVWWNTQAAYTSKWDALDFPGSPRAAYQLAGFDLVRAHLELALREPEYKFVLAEVDYLKPYWDAHPGDREVLRRLIAHDRVEVMGGTYNEPNTNLTSPESTIRNFVHGIGFQRHVLGADPQTAWQLDVFGHDPAFPGMAADAGLSSSSWARGPFHQWGPMEQRAGVKGDPTRMQFPSEFEWISPSGRGLLTSYMPDHYSAGWWMDASASLADAEAETLRLFQDLKKVATTKHVLLPVGTDYTPPNKWVTRIHRDWNSRYTWPRFICSLPKDFFAAVRAELAGRGEQPTPQTRDMNPVYTGKDVSYIDTKQAQRAGEDALLEAERFAVFATLLTGARYPDAAFAKAWVQLAYNAHHDGITGSESDQVYLDLLAGWREAHDLAVGARDSALRVLSGAVNTPTRSGHWLVVWNSLAGDRTDLVTLRLAEPLDGHLRVLDASGAEIPTLVEHEGTSITFLATEVPALGWQSYRLSTETVDNPVDDVDNGTSPVHVHGWQPVDGLVINNGDYRVEVDPDRGGGVCSLIELGTDRQLIGEGEVGNELALYEEYPQHPRFGEGPWHLLPRGPLVSSAQGPAGSVRALRCPIGERLEIRGRVGSVRYTQTITLWRGLRRVDCVTKVEEFTGANQLLRVRWPCPVPGALPVSEVGNAVVGRGFGLIDAERTRAVDSGKHPWTLDNPAYTWFGLSSTARVRAGDATRSLGVAEIVVPTRADAGPLARELTVALARSGVTATCGTAEGARYGHLDVDSNLPDVRITLGGPGVNTFTGDVLRRAGAEYQAELDRQLLARGYAVLWVPAIKPLGEVWVPSADLRDSRALPVLIVAGADHDRLLVAISSIVDDLGDHEIVVEQQVPAGDETAQPRTVALLNRGIPGFSVDSWGTLHTSLLRSCTGWPSGVWIDPPQRKTPDGSNFQLQHWTHVFEYALVSGDGDWRSAGIADASASYARSLLAVPTWAARWQERDVHSTRRQERDVPATLPASGSLLRVTPADAVSLATLKAAGNPLTRGSAEPADPAIAVALRLVETKGEPVTARVSSPVLRLADAVRADLLEHSGDSLPAADDPQVDLHGFEIATIIAKPELAKAPEPTVGGALLAPEAEPAQPLYARYWLHNRGPAPLGGLPVAVHLDPVRAELSPGRSMPLQITVASDRTDGDVHGLVRLVLPTSWAAEVTELPFDLSPGASVHQPVKITAPAGAVPGLYPIRAQLTLVGDDLPASWRQVVEDVAVLATAEDEPAPIIGIDFLDEAVGWRDAVTKELLRFVGSPQAVTVAAGSRARLTVTVASAAEAPIAVEAQLISPWGTWESVGPWSQGTEVGARGQIEFGFGLAPPRWAEPGRWWALVKVAGAGKLLYSPAVALEITP